MLNRITADPDRLVFFVCMFGAIVMLALNVSH